VSDCRRRPVNSAYGKPAAPPACSRLMEEDREGEPAEPAADWSDYAMAAVVAAVVLGMPLLVLLFR
jgi:hypothetical protein